MDFLNSKPIIELSGEEFLPIEGKTFVQQVEEFFQKQGGVAHSAFGDVILDKKGIRNDFHLGMSPIKRSSFAAIKDVLESGVIVLPLDFYNTNTKKQLTGMIAAPIKISYERYVCIVEVIANANKQRLYLHEAFLIKNLQEIVATSPVHDNNKITSRQPQGEIAKVLQNYVSANKGDINSGNLLNDKPIIELSGDEFLPKEGITFAQQVNEYFKSQGGKADSPFGEVLLDIKGIQNSKQHGMSRIKAAAFAAVKDVLEKGVEILPMEYHGVHDKKQMTGIIAAPIVIGVEKYICVVEVIANLEVNRLYVHEAFVIKTLFEDAVSNSVHDSKTTSPHPQGEVAKVLQNYVNANKNKTEIGV